MGLNSHEFSGNNLGYRAYDLHPSQVELLPPPKDFTRGREVSLSVADVTARTVMDKIFGRSPDRPVF